MQFDLPQETQDLTRELRRWVDAAAARGRPGLHPYERARWTDFLRWDLLGPEFSDSAQSLNTAAAFIEVGRGGLAGPVLEAYLAMCTGSSAALDALADGQVVTSIGPRPAGTAMIGWGGAADLVVDQLTGDVLAPGPLPAAELAYGLPHGWLDVTAAGADGDPLQERRWITGAALLSGLCLGAIELTRDHASTREQFGRPLAGFQAVQLPISEAFAYAEGSRLCALDAAWRFSIGDPHSTVAAALSWLWTTRAAVQVADVCHQTFGASGFCDETGLTQFTWQMSWLRLSVGSGPARRLVLADRRPDSPRNPPSLVLARFAQELEQAP